MAGIVDGMGFEEVNQEVTSTAIISGTNVYATTAVTAPAIIGTTSVSGVNVYAETAISGPDIVNAEGELQSTAYGSPAVFDGKIQAGIITLTGSEADLEFGVPFASKKWAITFGHSGAGAGTLMPTLSGAMTSSGATVIGDETATYYYIAAGY